MTISKDLYLAILSMDAYNRGYGAGITDGGNNDPDGLGEAGQIGSGSIVNPLSVGRGQTVYDAWQAAGFYAVAYTMGGGSDVPEELRGKTIISYRGTDNPGHELTAVDLPISFGGSYEQVQIAFAQKFFAAVDAAPNTGDLLLTGHSLGGALAGITGALTGTDAVLVDNIGFSLRSPIW